MSQTIEQEILGLEEQLLQAKRTLDIDAFQHLYSDNLMLTGVLGEPTCSKPAIIEEVTRGRAQRDSVLASGKVIEGSVDNEAITVAAYSDTAIATYRFVVKAKGENLDVSRRYCTTNVWIKREGRWQIVAAHGAFVIDAKQAATLAG